MWARKAPKWPKITRNGPGQPFGCIRMGSDPLLYARGHYGHQTRPFGARVTPWASVFGPFGPVGGPFTGRKTGFQAKFGRSRPAEARGWGLRNPSWHPLVVTLLLKTAPLALGPENGPKPAKTGPKRPKTVPKPFWTLPTRSNPPSMTSGMSMEGSGAMGLARPQYGRRWQEWSSGTCRPSSG